MAAHTIEVNRAPVLTLWAAVVAERLGYDEEAALSLGKAVAGLNAQSKGRRLGICEAPEAKPEKAPAKPPRKGARAVPLLGRLIPAVETAHGVRATEKDREVDPAPVTRYLEQKFGDALDDVRDAMRELARAYSATQLAGIGFSLYEKFRPSIPEGVRGWGAKGVLDLDAIRSLASKGR